MKHKLPIAITPAAITIENFCNELFTWSKETTTSPYGLHLGHYRVLVWQHSYNHIGNCDKVTNYDMKKKLTTIQDNCLIMNVAMINYAQKYSLIYDRWKTIITTIVPEDKNIVKINRVIIVHLHKCNLTANVSIHW